MDAKGRIIGHILKTYARESWGVRLFVLIRYLVCPWRKVTACLPLSAARGRLLDIGCGHGLLLHLIRLQSGGWTLTGIDHDSDKIDIARRSVPNGAAMIFGDTSQTLPPGQKFDCITLVDVLYAVEPKDWHRIWELVHTHLTPDGILLVKETVNHPRLKYWVCLLQEIAATKILKYTKGQFPFLPSRDHYLKELDRNGFDVIEHKRVDQGYLWPHYLFVGRRVG